MLTWWSTTAIIATYSRKLVVAVCFQSCLFSVCGDRRSAWYVSWCCMPVLITPSAEQAEIFLLTLSVTPENKVLANYIMESQNNSVRKEPWEVDLPILLHARIHVAQDFPWSWKSLRLYSMSWQPVSLLECTSCENISPYKQFELLLFQVMFIISCSSTMYYCETPGSVFLMTLS